jgi:hypothetical protein
VPATLIGKCLPAPIREECDGVAWRTLGIASNHFCRLSGETVALASDASGVGANPARMFAGELVSHRVATPVETDTLTG